MAKLIIKYLAAQRAINQSQLQMKASVTPQLLYRYWHNKTKSVELEQLEQIAKALGVKSSDLLVDDGELERYEQVEGKAS